MVLGIIPARFASSRFPGKPLIMIGGMSMVQRVYEQACQAKTLHHVVVATDDARIYDHVLSFGGAVLLTRPEHPSGTDRCAEAALHFPAAELVLNIQGDEPFVQPGQIDLLANTLMQRPSHSIATLAKAIGDPEQLHNPNVVKVVFSRQNSALYFSRHPIPYVRGASPESWLAHQTFYKHIGLYAYRARALQRISRLAPTALEKAESLEQLRWLENGLRIAVGLTALETIGIDTPEDLKKIP
ncbi:MAG: 3-deoxy-manno-octulosonate cytidylyltransferase [Saprospirales bacterium]|jgi:3-deoxy-manno-octulosonate cytidylyltransferase (CMP-KDO synthetase)|nr:3-deoxy-manno-octulosonate cytidylyltransferase [Saprospirales bacterium]